MIIEQHLMTQNILSLQTVRRNMNVKFLKENTKSQGIFHFLWVNTPSNFLKAVFHKFHLVNFTLPHVYLSLYE